jgi:hypothetical protein
MCLSIIYTYYAPPIQKEVRVRIRAQFEGKLSCAGISVWKFFIFPCERGYFYPYVVPELLRLHQYVYILGTMASSREISVAMYLEQLHTTIGLIPIRRSVTVLRRQCTSMRDDLAIDNSC